MRPHWGGLGAAALVCLSAATAHAASDTRRYLRSAATFYDALDFERALEQARKAEQFSKGPQDDVEIALVEGVLLANLEREDEADAAFRRGLSLQLDAKLPYKVSPKVVEQFEKVRSQVKKAQSRTPTVLEMPPPPVPEVKTPPPAVRAAPPEELSGGARRYAWIPTVGGALLGGAAAFAYVQSENRYSALEAGQVPLATATQYRSQGPTYQAVGLVLGAAGAAALVTAGVMFLAGGPAERVSVVPAPNGAVLVGSFP